jgi:hypothetical protein
MLYSVLRTSTRFLGSGEIQFASSDPGPKLEHK